MNRQPSLRRSRNWQLSSCDPTSGSGSATLNSKREREGERERERERGREREREVKRGGGETDT